MLAGGRMFPAAHPNVNLRGCFVSTIIGSAVQAAARMAFAALMPPTCCLCGAAGQEPDLDLCEVCATLFPVNTDPVAEVHAALPTVVRVLVPFQYAYPVDHLIRALKFRGERVYARVLGVLLARAHQALRPEWVPQVIVPVPLHSGRYRERGFNQSGEIARFAGRQLGVSVDAHCLVRKAATREQSGLSLPERRRNVQGAFAALRSMEGKRVALVDDVLTTGSTALAAAHALTDAGAEEIELWAVARVPLD